MFKRLALILILALLLFSQMLWLTPMPVQAQGFSCSNVSEIPTTECQALTTFYTSTNGAGWITKTGWLSTTTPCSWYGVACSAGHVTQLHIVNNQLSGTIPNFTNLPNLAGIHLNGNNLSGAIPNFDNLTKLQSLALDTNKLSGSIPNFANLSNLENLQLHTNKLSGAIPDIKLPKLVNFTVNNNSLTGAIPNFANLSNLIDLQLHNNKLTGSIPDFKLTKLITFTVNNNSLTGTIPDLTWSSFSHLVLNNNCGLIAFNSEQAKVLTSKDPDWEKKRSDCFALLSIVALAFDNDLTSTANLTPYYEDTMKNLIQATENLPTKTIVMLTDLSGVSNTFIQVITNGRSTPISGLPDSNGVMQARANLNEYDMANGPQLGGFLKWARATYPAAKVTFSFVGHGGAVVPETNMDLFPQIQLRRKPPIRYPKPKKPDITDSTSHSLLSPYDLAQALRIGTNDGQSPIDVVDLGQCFGSSIEQLYEIKEYAQTVTASPNYSYFDPPMLGSMIQQLDSSMSAKQLASTVIRVYDEVLPDTDHPRILVAVDTQQLTNIKSLWDNVADGLMDDLTNDPSAKDKMVDAYRASAKYDTTFCQADWDLASPDALVDMADFATQLGLQFNQVPNWADSTNLAIQQAIITKTVREGPPWFAPTKTWRFPGQGIGFYADLEGITTNNQTELSWHNYWYTDTVTADNPYPYQFIQNGQVLSRTWATVFARFWADKTITSTVCLPTVPVVRHEGELSGRITAPIARSVTLNSPVKLKAVISSTQTAYNPLVRFTVWQNNQPVFTEVVATQRLISEAHEISTIGSWLPQAMGFYTVTAEIDIDGKVIETNKADNQAIFVDKVLNATSNPRPILTASVNSIWLNTNIVPLIIQESGGVASLRIQIYQYQPGADPNRQVPFPVGNPLRLNWVKFSNVIVQLPSFISPGIVILYIWGNSSAGLSLEPAIVQFNYIPNDTPLAQGQFHYYMFEAQPNQKETFRLFANTGDPNLFIWHPYNLGQPYIQETHDGQDIASFIAPYPGQYIMAIYGQKATSYSLTQGDSASVSSRQANNVQAFIPTQRPQFDTPIPPVPLDNTYLPIIVR